MNVPHQNTAPPPIAETCDSMVAVQPSPALISGSPVDIPSAEPPHLPNLHPEVLRIDTELGSPYVSPELFGVQSRFYPRKLLGLFTSPFFVSMITHSILLAALTMIVPTAREGDQTIQLDGLTVDSMEPEPMDMADTVPMFTSPVTTVSDPAQEVAANFQTADRAMTDVALEDAELLTLVGSENSAALTSVLDRFGDELGAPVTGTNNPNAHQAQFFGIQSAGDRFVFVIDSSKSMSGRRWIMAVRELWKSLEKLHEDQQFFLVCFDEKTHLMLRQKPHELTMVSPTAENIKRVKRWTASIGYGRATLPRDSLAFALSLHPDAIYVLSDGEFMDDSRWYLRQENREMGDDMVMRALIPIHTIAIQSEAGAVELKKIADEQEGQFRFVR